MKIIVFDLGGTLMEYKGMPYSWVEYYENALTCGFRKPSKNGLIFIAEYFKVDVQNLVFVGDEEKDIKTAKNAGCISVLINRGNDKRNYGQNFSITSLNECINFA